MIGPMAAYQGTSGSQQQRRRLQGLKRQLSDQIWAASAHRYSQVFHRSLVILCTQLSTGSSRPETASRGHCQAVSWQDKGVGERSGVFGWSRRPAMVSVVRENLANWPGKSTRFVLSTTKRQRFLAIREGARFHVKQELAVSLANDAPSSLRGYGHVLGWARRPRTV